MTDETLWIVSANDISTKDTEGAENPWNSSDEDGKETIESVAQLKEVSVQKLEEELSKFVKAFSGVLDQAENAIPPETGVKLGEIELSVEITGQGDIKLLGTAIKEIKKGGLTLKFQKNIDDESDDKGRINVDDDSVEKGGRNFTEDLGKGIKLEMVYIPAGEFMMGSHESEYERPIHKVTFKQGFYMGKYPITQAQYQAIMGKNPSYFSDHQKAPLSSEDDWGNYPVDKVSWYDAQEFCKKLSARTGKNYKLPSESQWEYACRATPLSKESYQRRLTTTYCFGDNHSQLAEYAWYKDNSGRQTHPVGQKKPNKWGLYDMHGNVWEWCEDDWYDNYHNAPNDGTAWRDKTQNTKVARGGSWPLSSTYCRSAYRDIFIPSFDNFTYGLRVVCS